MNKQHQEEIFCSFSLQDLDKLMVNLEDENPTLRKISARFLCELLYNNQKTQTLFCEMMNIFPIQGKVCINNIPSQMLSVLKNNPKILQTLPQSDEHQNSLCWYFSLVNAKHNINQLNYFYRSKSVESIKLADEFIDPQQTIFGFSIYSQSLYEKDTSTLTSTVNTTTYVTSRDSCEVQGLNEGFQNGSSCPMSSNLSSIVPATKVINLTSSQKQAEINKFHQPHSQTPQRNQHQGFLYHRNSLNIGIQASTLSRRSPCTSARINNNLSLSYCNNNTIQTGDIKLNRIKDSQQQQQQQQILQQEDQQSNSKKSIKMKQSFQNKPQQQLNQMEENAFQIKTSIIANAANTMASSSLNDGNNYFKIDESNRQLTDLQKNSIILMKTEPEDMHFKLNQQNDQLFKKEIMLSASKANPKQIDVRGSQNVRLKNRSSPSNEYKFASICLELQNKSQQEDQQQKVNKTGVVNMTKQVTNSIVNDKSFGGNSGTSNNNKFTCQSSNIQQKKGNCITQPSSSNSMEKHQQGNIFYNCLNSNSINKGTPLTLTGSINNTANISNRIKDNKENTYGLGTRKSMDNWMQYLQMQKKNSCCISTTTSITNNSEKESKKDIREQQKASIICPDKQMYKPQHCNTMFSPTRGSYSQTKVGTKQVHRDVIKNLKIKSKIQ